jgi:hypothetical protein
MPKLKTRKMKKMMIAGFVLFAMNFQATSQTNPAITSWIINTTGLTGYNCPTCTTPVYGSIAANIQSVSYTATTSYVKSQGIPSYNVGPWSNNPNTPSAQNKTWAITLSPTNNTGAKTTTGLGVIGIWSNGVGIFNPMDGYYWNSSTNAIAQGMGTWNRNAYIFEGVSFDACLGHPNQTGAYHNHVIPKCLFAATDSSAHSPIIGYAFDGFPIYGPYAYTNVNGTGAIKRMVPSYKLTTATTRASGPSMSTAVTIAGVASTYYAGTFLEDYTYSAGLGDLDQYNGRFCVTPEYPAGIYAYFVTVDPAGKPIYPYVLGPQFYGVVPSGNTGPGGGANTIPAGATTYTPATGINEYNTFPEEIKVYPNPVQDNTLQFEISNNSNDLMVRVMDYQGRVLVSKMYHSLQYDTKLSLALNYLSSGIYIVSFEGSGHKMAKRIMVNEE